jgi:electron transfer flavoprotein alpha subunit
MSILVYIDTIDGQIKKSAFELLTYARKTAEAHDLNFSAAVIGPANNITDVQNYGAQKIYHLAKDDDGFDTRLYAKRLVGLTKELDAQIVLFSHSSSGKSLAGYLSVLIDATVVTGVNSLPEISEGHLKVHRNVFSGKAEATLQAQGTRFILSLIGNTLRPESIEQESPVETRNSEEADRKVQVREINTISGKTPLPEAELVVSAGRGMKGPENWGIIEELAEVVGATTACSRPVADSDWRPHHEHVGQTGVAIRPNLYIAIGISGAIQHLAGVNQSKTIVVINKDPEAPFFKAADYGVCADLFDVVPKLIESFKKFRSEN